MNCVRSTSKFKSQICCAFKGKEQGTGSSRDFRMKNVHVSPKTPTQVRWLHHEATASWRSPLARYSKMDWYRSKHEKIAFSKRCHPNKFWLLFRGMVILRIVPSWTPRVSVYFNKLVKISYRAFKAMWICVRRDSQILRCGSHGGIYLQYHFIFMGFFSFPATAVGIQAYNLSGSNQMIQLRLYVISKCCPQFPIYRNFPLCQCIKNICYRLSLFVFAMGNRGLYTW